MKKLLSEIKQCKLCEPNLALGANTLVTAHPNSKIVIIGQAPGTAVHKSSIPWNDKSGDNLRDWLGIDKTTFYNTEKIAIMPMGFCYPGKGITGDLPPRNECAPLWHPQLFEQLKNVELILLIGKYAQEYYLKEQAERTLTETVKNFKAYLPQYFVLPHPSPRNNIWQAKNEWFGKEVLPELKHIIKPVLGT